MLGVRHTGRVAWRRKRASRHYAGPILHVTVAEAAPAMALAA